MAGSARPPPPAVPLLLRQVAVAALRERATRACAAGERRAERRGATAADRRRPGRESLITVTHRGAPLLVYASESPSILRTATCSLAELPPVTLIVFYGLTSTCGVQFLTERRRLTRGYKALISRLSVTSDILCTQMCKLSLLLQSSVGEFGCFMVCSVRCDSRYSMKGKKARERERERGGVWGVRRRAGPCRHFVEVSVTLTHHRCTFTQQEMHLLHQCFLTFAERLSGFSRNPLPNTHTLNFSASLTTLLKHRNRHQKYTHPVRCRFAQAPLHALLTTQPPS